MAAVDGSDDGLVSVIVPAYNCAAFVGRTLDSIAAQTHRNIEIIVVDDGSTDGTAEIVEAFVRREPRARLYRGAHRGVPAARNLAAAQARGAFLAPCDSDDLWRADKIALQLAALRASPDAGVANCWSVGIDEADAVILPAWSRSEATGDVLLAMIENSLPGSGSAPLMRRTCFDAAGGYPLEIPNGDEWHLYIALAGLCRFVVVREFLVGYRLRRGSISNDFRQVEYSLAATTRWLTAKWPDTPRAVLRRRAFTVQRYLAFLCARNGLYGKALRYQFGAVAAQPLRALGLPSVEFLWLVVSQALGIERYYYCFWRRPVRWEGAAS